MHRFTSKALVSIAVLCAASSSFAQTTPPRPTQGSSPEGTPSEGSNEAKEQASEAPRSAAPGEAIVAKKDKALINYSVGNVESALANLRALVLECDDSAADQCPDEVRAELLVAVAIVLAGGKNDIEGAARSFHAALTLYPDVTVPRQYATIPVQKAMRRANESTSFRELSEPPSPPRDEQESVAPPQPEPPQVEPSVQEQTQERDFTSNDKTGIVLLYGLAGSGEAEDVVDVVSIGAGAVLGVRFARSSAWTTAVRARAVSTGGSTAIGGLAVLTGSSWFGSNHKRKGYVLGGMGIDSYLDQATLNVSGMGGLSLGGFLLGGGADFGGNRFGGYALLSLHLGYAGAL